VLTEDERGADIDTVGGLVFTLAGRVPARGEVLSHPSGIEFRVLDADPRRIRRLRVRGGRAVPAQVAAYDKTGPKHYCACSIATGLLFGAPMRVAIGRHLQGWIRTQWL
jgi:hypothetical protein